MTSLIDQLCELAPKNDWEMHPVISLRNRYMYIPIGKVANSSIKHALRTIEAEPKKYEVTDPHERFHTPLVTPYQCGDAFFANEVLQGDFYRFAFVRNPFSRLLSCYLDRIAGRGSITRARRVFHRTTGVPMKDIPSFEVFIRNVCKQDSKDQNEHWRDQWSVIGRDVITYNYIAKFEKLQEEAAHISQDIFGDKTVFSVGSNKSPQKTSAAKQLAEFYSPELVKLVVDRYSEDFARFGYPTSLEDAG